MKQQQSSYDAICTYFGIVPFLLTVVNCGTLSNPARGHVSHTGGTTFGKRATYSCNKGYNLVGSSTRTCQTARLWSGSAPTCQGNCFLKLTSDVANIIN